MDTTPSGQDETQAYELGRKHGMPWMLRGIVNKNGKMSLDLFWFEYGFVIRDLDWDIMYNHDDARTAKMKEEVTKLVRPFRSTAAQSWQAFENNSGRYQYGYSYGGD